tara:strand:- start:31098 stop:33461 length:2364 start_codon:yes stop_codon:yes gene_type:complete
MIFSEPYFCIVELYLKYPKITRCMRSLTFKFFTVFIFVQAFVSAQITTSTAPNIIFFIVDDLGYMDLSCYGSDFYETPNIDQLATDGIRFTHGYEAAPRCAASRTSIMSGKFESRPSVSQSMYLPSDNNPNGYAETTFAQALKDEGYKTLFIGKWHLGHDEDHYPDSFGFDINIAGCDFGSPPTYWYPYSVGSKVMPDLSMARHPNYNDNGVDKDEYLTDRITNEVKDFITDHTANNPTVPFLTMVSHYGVHVPFEAKESHSNYYEDKVTNQNYQGPEYVADLTMEAKLNQDNYVYAAMIKSIDESLGALRQSLIDNGIADNTIIVVTSDNGGLSTKGHGSSRERATSNKPLRGGKTWLYEGGIRLPLIVYGPDYRSGIVESRPVVGTDFYPTFLEMAGVNLLPEQHLDGESFEKVLLTNANGGDESHLRSKSIYWNFDYASDGTANVSMAAVRYENYKLLEYKYDNRFELYDVVNDIGETTDISASNAVLAEQLKDTLFSFRSKAGVSHRVTNSGFKETNKLLYDSMNAILGTDVQEDFGCSTPASLEVIYNKDFECWYDLDWNLRLSSPAQGTMMNSGVESRTGNNGVHINVTTKDALFKVRLENTSYYDDFNGATVKVGAYVKSSNSNKIKFQIKTDNSDESSKTYISSKFTTTGSYQYYEYTFNLNDVETDFLTVRLQCGEDTGDVYIDDWFSEVSNSNLSTRSIDTSSIIIIISPNPTQDFIHIDGPLITKKVMVIDQTGKLIKKELGNIERLSLRDLQPGIYMVKVFFENNTYVFKRIIKS